MSILDIFNGDAFKSVTMDTAIRESGFVPNFLSGLNIFQEQAIDTEGVAIEKMNGFLSVVPTTPRGSPAPQYKKEKSNLRNFLSTRIAQGDRITASELNFLRRFGTEDQAERAVGKVAERLGVTGSGTGIMTNLGLTLEHMMVNIIKTGKFIDKDGTVLVDWGNELRSDAQIATNAVFSVPVVTFDFATLDNGDLREKLNQVAREMVRSSKGLFTQETRINVLVGDEFFDALGKNAEIRNHHSRKENASWVEGANKWSVISYAGFNFINYRGTDDNATVAVDLTKGHCFPVNTNGIFKHWYSHGESFDDLGQMGQFWYTDIVPDKDRDRYVDIDVAHYPLLGCTAPQVLREFVLA